MRMIDESETPRPEPRWSVQFNNNGTWSASYGSLPLGTGFATVTDAWNVIEQHVAAMRTPRPLSPTPRVRR